MISRRLGAGIFIIAGLVAAALYILSRAGASQPYDPTFQLVSISSQATNANADITLRTALPSGNHIIANWGLEIPLNSWNIAGDNKVPDGYVTAFGTLAVSLEPDGNCNDGDSGTPQTYGPFGLRDQATDPPDAPHAQWSGIITDFGDGNANTTWYLTLVVEGNLTGGFAVDGLLTDAVLPSGSTVCTPQTFTLTLCGNANPSASATVCGSGSNPAVWTNPASPATYTWVLSTIDESGFHFARREISICIDPPCPTPTPTPVPPTPTPTPTPAPSDPDGDGFSSTLEAHVGTDPLLKCGTNANPADFNNDLQFTGADLSTVGAEIGKTVPPAAVRLDIAPEPGGDNNITGADQSAVGARIGKTC